MFFLIFVPCEIRWRWIDSKGWNPNKRDLHRKNRLEKTPEALILLLIGENVFAMENSLIPAFAFLSFFLRIIFAESNGRVSPKWQTYKILK